MRIGIIGWYGHDNAGDERILACLKQLFAGDEFVVSSAIHDARDRFDAFNACDLVIFGGGGLVLRGVGQFAEFFQRLKPPLCCLGLGIDTDHADAAALVDVLRARSRHFVVRDNASRGRAGGGGGVQVAPDLTFLYPFDIVEPVVDDVCGLNVRPWQYWHFEYQGVASSFIRRLDRRFDWFRRCYPLPRWDAQAAVDLLRRAFAELVPVTFYKEQGIENDETMLRQLLGTTSDEPVETQMSRCRYVVSMRYHGLLFACQMGIPFISLSYQPKNVAFCQEVQCSEMSLPLTRYKLLPQKADDLKARFEPLREQLLRYRAGAHQRVWDVIGPIRDAIRNGG